MTQLEGRAMLGLDEFMLRLGHLTVLTRAAAVAGSSAHRFAREFAERLSRLVPIPDETLPAVIRYLRAKKLCPEEPERRSPSFDPSRFRYPDLLLAKRGNSDFLESVDPESTSVQITWQDLCLADEGVQSRVGSVTAHGKRGSKTGLSHVVDWAVMLDLTNASGDLTAHGQLLAHFEARRRSSNPYIIGNERIIFAELYVRNDFDVFATLIALLSFVGSPIRKRDAVQYYVEAVQLIADAAETAKHLSQRQRTNLYSLWRDLRRLGRGDDIVTSTAWHRAASRFETYVDLGLLRKGLASEDERYEYKYYVSDTLRSAASTLASCRDAELWISEHLADVILGPRCSRAPFPPEDLIELLPAITQPLARPTSPLPIDALASGLLWLAADFGRPISVGAARQSIEDLAIKRPDVARLSTGTTTRAEYISIKSMKAQRDGPRSNLL